MRTYKKLFSVSSAAGKLKGEITTNTSKNGAMGLICASLINSGKTTLHKVPRIEEVNRVLEIFKSIGVNYNWVDKNTLVIKPTKEINIEQIDIESAKKIRSILMMIGPLAHKTKKFKFICSG
jgi:UDP-N-acetylglucosamine 1-carboxyvinyltransferase